MKRFNTSPLLLYRGEQFNANFFYFSGIDIDHAFLLSMQDKQILFVPRMNERLANELFNGEIIAYKNPWDELKKVIRGKKTFIDGSSVSARAYEKLKKFCKPVDITEKLLIKRMEKSEDEVEKIAEAVRITKDILESIDLSKHNSEEAIRRFLLKETLERGLAPAFDPVVAADSNSAHPHYQGRFNDRKIGTFVLIDYGVCYQHYCSDITRVFFLKRDRNKIEKYQHLGDVVGEIIKNSKNFKTSRDLALFGEQLFNKYKLPAPLHSIGHGVGLDIHEYPRLNKRYKDALKGTVFALEPAIYTSDFGLRYEETIYFDGKKARIL